MCVVSLLRLTQTQSIFLPPSRVLRRRLLSSNGVTICTPQPFATTYASLETCACVGVARTRCRDVDARRGARGGHRGDARRRRVLSRRLARTARPLHRYRHQCKRRDVERRELRRRRPSPRPHLRARLVRARTRVARRPPRRHLRSVVHRRADGLTRLQPLRCDPASVGGNARRRRRARVRYPRRRRTAVHLRFDDGLRDAERGGGRQRDLGARPAQPDRRDDRRRSGARPGVPFVRRPVPDPRTSRHDRRRTRPALQRPL